MKGQIFYKVIIVLLLVLVSGICLAQAPVLPAPVLAVPESSVTPVSPPAPVPAVPGSAVVAPVPDASPAVPVVPASPPIFNISSTPTEKEVTLPVVNIPVTAETTNVILGIVTGDSRDTTRLIIPITAGQKIVASTPVASSTPTPKVSVSKVTPMPLVTLNCDSVALYGTISEVGRVGVDISFLTSLSLTPAEIQRVVGAFRAAFNEDGERGVEKFAKKMEKEFEKLNKKGKDLREIVPVAVSSRGLDGFLDANTICAMAEQLTEPNRIELARQLKMKPDTYSKNVLIGLGIAALVIGFFLGRVTKKGGGGKE